MELPGFEPGSSISILFSYPPWKWINFDKYLEQLKDELIKHDIEKSNSVFSIDCLPINL